MAFRRRRRPATTSILEESCHHTFLISSASLSPSTFCLDSSTVCTLRLRCSRRLLSRFLCLMCSLRLASIRFRSACSSDCEQKKTAGLGSSAKSQRRALLGHIVYEMLEVVLYTSLHKVSTSPGGAGNGGHLLLAAECSFSPREKQAPVFRRRASLCFL